MSTAESEGGTSIYSTGSARRAAAAEELRQRVDEEVQRWKTAAQDELGVRMQLSKDRRTVQLELQQTLASSSRSQRRRDEQHHQLIELRGRQETCRVSLTRAQAALEILQPRLTGEPAARASAHANAPVAGYAHQRAGESGGEGGGGEGREWTGGGRRAGNEKAILMAQEKAVYLLERVHLLHESARHRQLFEVAREQRAEVECRRERWALSQMRGGGGGGGGGDGQELMLGGRATDCNGGGGRSDEGGWDLPGFDQIARLIGAHGGSDTGLGGGGSDERVARGRMRGERQGVAEALMSVGVEKEEACKVLAARDVYVCMLCTHMHAMHAYVHTCMHICVTACMHARWTSYIHTCTHTTHLLPVNYHAHQHLAERRRKLEKDTEAASQLLMSARTDKALLLHRIYSDLRSLIIKYT